MKVLHIQNHFFPCIGGVESLTLNLCRELKKRGHESDVLCLNACSNSKEKLNEMEEFEGIKIYRIPFLDLKYYKIAPKVLEYLKDYDLLHVHGIGFFSDFLAKKKKVHGKRMVVNTHGLFFHTKNISAFKKIYFKHFLKNSLKEYCKVIADSESDFEKVSQVAENVVLVENGVEVKKKGKKEENSFLFAGRIAENKRIDLLLVAMEKSLKNGAKLYVVGEDWQGLEKGLKKKAEELGVEERVEFAGKVSEEELNEFYAKSEFFVSASEFEGFGLTAIEAMSAGCIPILNRIPSFEKFVVEGKNGFLVDFSDAEKTGEKILKAMNAKNKKELAKSVEKKAEKYSWKRKVEEYEKIYLQCIGGRK